jgi:two-component system KDP operon response regulator KdpE
LRTILIAEDEDDIRLLLRLSLRSEPYRILEAATGAEAAEQWSRANLVLLDIRLPDIDGLDLLRRLGSKTAPVIALSAHSEADQRAAAIEAGCVDYFTKPFTPAKLLDAIRTHLASEP